MKYLRFSILVGVPDEIDETVVENDVRDYVEGNFNFIEDDANLPSYGMVVSEISFEGDESRPNPEPHAKDCLCDVCETARWARLPGETRREYKLRTGANP